MEESLEELQASLLGIFKNVLMHEHFFTTIADAYETAVCRPMSTFPLIPLPPEVVYRTKQKSKGKPLPEKPADEDSDSIHIPRAFGLICNDSLLTRIKSSQPDFHHIVSDFKSRIHSAKGDAQASKTRFLTSLHSRYRPEAKHHPWSAPSVNSFASYSLLEQMLKLLSSEGFMKQVLGACVADDQSYYTVQEATVVMQALLFLTWVDTELPKIREKVREDGLTPVLDSVKSLVALSNSNTAPLFDDFKGENRFLTRLKECTNDSEFSKLQKEYLRFSLWHAQAEVLKYIKTSSPSTVPVIRALLSIIQHGGKRICTVLRETK